MNTSARILMTSSTDIHMKGECMLLWHGLASFLSHMKHVEKAPESCVVLLRDLCLVPGNGDK